MVGSVKVGKEEPTDVWRVLEEVDKIQTPISSRQVKPRSRPDIQSHSRRCSAFIIAPAIRLLPLATLRVPAGMLIHFMELRL